MYYNRFTLCDNIRVIELAAELPNMEAEMDLALFIQVAITDHLDDENDSILELGTLAEIRLCPNDGEVELTTRNGAAVMSSYQFYGIKNWWDLGKLIHISDEFAAAINRDIHRDPDEEGGEYEADFGEH